MQNTECLNVDNLHFSVILVHMIISDWPCFMPNVSTFLFCFDILTAQSVVLASGSVSGGCERVFLQRVWPVGRSTLKTPENKRFYLSATVVAV
jgi:hypothetical protein